MSVRTRSPGLKGIAQMLLGRRATKPSQSARATRGIPDPHADVESLHHTVSALKEQVEILTRDRGFADDGAMLIGDYPILRAAFLDAPHDEAQYGLINGRWVPLGLFLPLTAAPAAPVIGMVVFANGTTWNPGSGAGLYVYKAAGWTFIV